MLGTCRRRRDSWCRQGAGWLSREAPRSFFPDLKQRYQRWGAVGEPIIAGHPTLDWPSLTSRSPKMIEMDRLAWLASVVAETRDSQPSKVKSSETLRISIPRCGKDQESIGVLRAKF